MIITVTLNPAVDKTVEIGNFEVGAVNRVSSIRLDGGGKGINVSKVIKRLGGRSRASGILGGASGRFVKEYVDSLGIENDFLFIEGETRTNLKIVDSHRKTNTDINEPGPQVGIEDIEKLEKIVFGNMERDSILVLSGSVPVNVDKNIYARWIERAKKVGTKTLLDADGELLKQGVKAGPFLVKPNIHELERLLGTTVKDCTETERLARGLMEACGIEMAAVSLGEKGSVFLNKEASVFAHGLKVPVKSTVGAGDSMVAALAYSIDRGCGFEKAVMLAAAASTANVMTPGTQPPSYEVITALERKVLLSYIYPGK